MKYIVDIFRLDLNTGNRFELEPVTRGGIVEFDSKILAIYMCVTMQFESFADGSKLTVTIPSGRTDIMCCVKSTLGNPDLCFVIFLSDFYSLWNLCEECGKEYVMRFPLPMCQEHLQIDQELIERILHAVRS